MGLNMTTQSFISHFLKCGSCIGDFKFKKAQKTADKKSPYSTEHIPLAHLVWSCPTHTKSLQTTVVAAEWNNISYYEQIVNKAAYNSIHRIIYVSYTLRRLIRWGCFSFEKCIRNGFVWKCVVFQDGEERTVPTVPGVWSFKSQH